jgi:hypothetical protein
LEERVAAGGAGLRPRGAVSCAHRSYFGALQERGVADIFQYALMAELACVRRGELVDLFQRKILVPHWQTATTLHNVRFCVLALLGYGDAPPRPPSDTTTL